MIMEKRSNVLFSISDYEYILDIYYIIDQEDQIFKGGAIMAKITVDDLNAVRGEAHKQLLNEDGFILLQPTKTKDGKDPLERFTKKSGSEKQKPNGKKSNQQKAKAAGKASSSEKALITNPRWDLDLVDKSISWAVKKAEKGQFDRILKQFQNRPMFDLYLNHLIQDCEIQQGDDYFKEVSILDRAIRIGKTFFEFSDNPQGFIDNFRYDMLLFILKKYEDEPTAYTPEGKRTKTETVDVEYSVLAINTDKCYALRSGDKVPEGVKETDSVEAWLRRSYKALNMNPDDVVSIAITPKLDGIALRGQIDPKNHLVRPMLRGDEKKSILVKGLDGVKLSQDKPISNKPFGCQFEAFVTYEDMEDISEYLEMDRPYVSPRHAASGVLNRLAGNPDNKLIPYISFYPINTVDLPGSYVDRLKAIRKLSNCDVVKPIIVKGKLEDLLDEIGKRFDKLNDQRATLPYAIDGIVLAFADDEHQKLLGRKGRTNKWQMAYKFDPASAVGEVKGIELSSGKKGFRTIQIVLKEPVSIDGVKYDHIPALSGEIFEKLDLCEGDLVRVHRVGDVIPSISIENRKGGKKIELPKYCQSCGEKLSWVAKKLKCVNPHCPDNMVGVILSFLDAAGIKGVGEAEARNLVYNRIRTIEEIIMSYEYNRTCWDNAGYTKKRAVEFRDSVLEALKNMWDYEFIATCGFPGVGPETAKKIYAKNVGDLESVKDYILAVVTAVSEQPVESKNSTFDVLGWKVSSQKEKNNIISMIGNIGVMVEFASRNCKQSTADRFNNLKSVGHTGGMPSKETRKLIQDHGWEIVDGRKFDYLIVPGYDHESTKTKYAKDKRIPMYTEADFVKEFSTD